MPFLFSGKMHWWTLSVCVVWGIEPRVPHMLGKYYITKLIDFWKEIQIILYQNNDMMIVI